MVMHGRSHTAIDPCTPAMPGRSTSGLHRPGQALLAPSAKRNVREVLASRMKGGGGLSDHTGVVRYVQQCDWYGRYTALFPLAKNDGALVTASSLVPVTESAAVKSTFKSVPLWTCFLFLFGSLVVSHIDV